MSNQISIQDSIAVVSGANRGIGKAITEELLSQGIQKVYAGARNLQSLEPLTEKYGYRVVPIALDVTYQTSVDEASKLTQDANILINNAGVLVPGGYTSGSMLDAINNNFDVNVYGVARLTQAMLPSIQNMPQGAIATVSSVIGLGNMPMANAYSASKAAVHSMIQGLRGELKDSAVLVSGIYPGPIATEMTQGFENVPMDTPEVVAKNVVDGIANGKEDIFPDSMSKNLEQGSYEIFKAVEKQMAEFI